MSRALTAVLIGCGQVGVGLGHNAQYKKYYRYATHADVLCDHPDFNWVAAVDLLRDARQSVVRAWPKVAVAASLAKLPAGLPSLDVAVIATPPGFRLALLEQLPSTIRAVVVEKPLGMTPAEGEEFLARARAKRIAVYVNLWRRVDTLHRDLAYEGLAVHIGEVQGMSVVYGGGLRATATHLIDWVALVAGPITSVQAVPESIIDGPADPSFSFAARCAQGVLAMFLAVNIKHYREVHVDIYGTKGRLTIANEALVYTVRKSRPHRAMPGFLEIASDGNAKVIKPSVGEAYYNLYTNVAQAERGDAAPLATGEMALTAARVVAAVEESGALGGEVVAL